MNAATLKNALPAPVARPSVSPEVRRSLASGPASVQDTFGIQKGDAAESVWSADAAHVLILHKKKAALYGSSGRLLARADAYREGFLGLSADGGQTYWRADHKILRTDIRAGEQKEAPFEVVLGCALARGAIMAASVGLKDGRAKDIWVYDGQLAPLRQIDFASPYAAWLSPDGRHILATSWDHERGLAIIDADTTAVRAGVLNITANTDIAFAEEARRALVGADGHFYVLDYINGKVLQSRESADISLKSYLSFAIAPHGDRVVVPSGNAYVVLDVESGKETVLPFSIASSVKQLLFSPDGDVLLARFRSDDGIHVEAFSGYTGKFLWRHIERCEEGDSPLALSPDGSQLNIGNRRLVFSGKRQRRHVTKQQIVRPKAPSKVSTVRQLRQRLEDCARASDTKRVHALMWRYLCRGEGGRDDAAVLRRGAELLKAFCLHTPEGQRKALVHSLLRLTGDRVQLFASAGRMVEELQWLQMEAAGLANSMFLLGGAQPKLAAHVAQAEAYMRDCHWDAALAFALAAKLTPAVAQAWRQFADAHEGRQFMVKIMQSERNRQGDIFWLYDTTLSDEETLRAPAAKRLCAAYGLGEHPAWVRDVVRAFSDAQLAAATTFFESPEGRIVVSAMREPQTLRDYQVPESGEELERIMSLFT